MLPLGLGKLLSSLLTVRGLALAKSLLPLVNTFIMKAPEKDGYHRCFCLTNSHWKFIIYAEHFQTPCS